MSFKIIQESSTCIGSISDILPCQIIHYPCINITESNLLLRKFLFYVCYILNQPQYFEKWEVRTGNKTNPRFHIPMLLSKSICNIHGTAITPYDGIVKGFASLWIPSDNSLTLVRHSNTLNGFQTKAILTHFGESLFSSLMYISDDFHGIMLKPSLLGYNLFMLKNCLFN
jgi:hypothetical protein